MYADEVVLRLIHFYFKSQPWLTSLFEISPMFASPTEDQGQDEFDWSQFGISNQATKTPDMAKLEACTILITYYYHRSNLGRN